MVENVQSEVRERADACIIGSGAGGAAVAWELAKEGKTVVVLEKGSHFKVSDFDNMSELELLSLWKGHGSQLSRASLEDFPVNVAQGECLGGSTVINWGICFPTPPAVLDRWTTKYNVENISHEHMKPFFVQVFKDLSVTKITNAGGPHKLLKQGCESFKPPYEGDWMSRNCRDCTEKRSALVTFLKWVDERGGRIYTDAVAQKILIREGKAVGVEGRIFNRQSNKSYKIHVDSKIVILAAGAIASSAFLLKNNLANSSGQVGHGLSLHPSPAIIAEFEEEVNSQKELPMAFFCSEFNVMKTRQPGFMIESVCLAPAQLAPAIPSFGLNHKELMKNYVHYAPAGILIQDEPLGSVTLNWGGEAVINYRLGAREIELLKKGIKETARVYLAAGAIDVFTSHINETPHIQTEKDLDIIEKIPVYPGSIALGSAHPQGGDRMGSNKTESVVDSYCETHDVRNLFVCDASVFPTSVGVNPQITVMALAARTGHYINQNSAKYFA